MDYNKVNKYLTVIWFVILCVGAYIVIDEFPTDFIRFQNVDYTLVSLGVAAGIFSSLPLVWVVYDYLIKKSWIISFILVFLPSIAKYIPGKIWTFVGFVFQAKTMANIPKKDSIFFQVYSQIVTILSSVFLTIICVVIIFFFKNSQFTLAVTGVAVIFLLVAIVSILILTKIAKKYNHSVDNSRIKSHVVALGIQKILKGLSLALFLSGFMPVYDYIFEIVFAFVIAIQVGALAIFAPAGLGVTEGAYVMLFSDQLTLAVAVQIAVLARVWQTVLDFSLATIAFVLKVAVVK